jgi:hypothetical protein
VSPDVFGGTPNTAGQRPALPIPTESFRLRWRSRGIGYYVDATKSFLWRNQCEWPPVKFFTPKAAARLAAVSLVFAAGIWYMVGRPGRGNAIMTPPAISADTLRAHIQALAGDIGERNVFHPGTLDRAADYIKRQWEQQGFTIHRQSYAPHPGKPEQVRNIEVIRAGTTKSNEIIVVGAHYDSVFGCPGANDNASGVAALLELSRHCSVNVPATRTLRFVAFANEEPPFFQTPQQGSRVYARACRERGDDVRAMIALETMGCFSEETGSQSYPFPFGLFYPSRGNFIGFISDLKSRGVMRRAVSAFRAHSDFPVESCATFSAVPGIDWSDHGSFWHEGYRAFMVTDTAPFRYHHYHRESDTTDKVNYEALAKITSGLCGVIASLAGAE